MSFHYIFVVGSEYKGMLTAFLLNSIKKKTENLIDAFYVQEIKMENCETRL